MASNKQKPYNKWEVVIVDLNPVRGSEMSKIRPCLIVSPAPMNRFMNTVIIVPFTSVIHGYPFRLPSSQKSVRGELCFDQIKSVDKGRITKRAGTIPEVQRPIINQMLAEIFSEE